MRKYFYIATLALTVALLCIRSTPQTGAGKSNDEGSPLVEGTELIMSTPTEPQQPLSVSIIRLIANPAPYDGRLVRVTGFCRIEFERTAVYLHQEDSRVGISKNALWLDIDRSDRQRYTEGDQKYVLIEGTFDANNAGHRGLFSGAIREIKRFQVQSQ